jgi:hypothetical protein
VTAFAGTTGDDAGVALASIASTYREVVVDEGTQPLLFMLVAFGITFGITRFITHSIRSHRFSWLGNVEAGDTHIHHLVWGICLLLVAGILAIVVQPPLEVVAVVFGIGAALTLDEFALWLHLDDVYWSEQGRQSIDAVIVFTIVTGFMLVGAYPISIGPEPDFGDVINLILTQLFNLTFVVICLMKGKLMYGVLGFYIPPIAIVGSLRLARPDSRWARKRYDEEKVARSRARYDVEKKTHRPRLDRAPAPASPGSGSTH